MMNHETHFLDPILSSLFRLILAETVKNQSDPDWTVIRVGSNPVAKIERYLYHSIADGRYYE